MTEHISQELVQLTTHLHQMRYQHPQERLMVVFDVDGTILDMRYMVLNVLKAFDQHHETRLFYELTVDDITFHENQVEFFINNLKLERWEKAHIHHWYLKHRWTPPFILNGHCGFPSILGLIGSLQMQPDVEIGLNTGRPEIIRRETLQCLNDLATAYGFSFADEFLYMNPGVWEEGVTQHKIAGMQYFQQMGYRVVAFVDNEPANLAAVARFDPDILLLHADTLYESDDQHLPVHSLRVRL